MAGTDLILEPTLSGREHEILELVARGLSAREVARQLGISPRTVASHVDHIRLKFRAKNRVQMVATALVGGYIGLGPNSAGNEIKLQTELHPNRRDAIRPEK